MPSVRYDLDPNDRAELGNEPGVVPIELSAEQIKAMAHAIEDTEQVAVSIANVDAAEAAIGDAYAVRTLVITSYDDEGWVLVNYKWNEGGCGAWLAKDGGWHYQPGESGYYPWRAYEEAE